MADNALPVQGKDYALAGSGVSSTATTIVLTSFKDPQGTNITMTDFGAIGYGTLEPGTVREENFSFTGVTQNANGTADLTGVTRGLKFVSDFTADSSLRQAHAGGTIMRISDSAPFFSNYANKKNDETVEQTWTFTDPNVPRMDTSHSYTAGEEEYFATKRYVDGVALSGAPDASTTAKGVAEEATEAEIDADTGAGGTSARLFVNPSTLITSKYGLATERVNEGTIMAYASTTGNDTYVITPDPAISAYSEGMSFRVSADTANTGAATLNVSAVGAKTIKKYTSAGALTDIETGDIIADIPFEVIYNSNDDSFVLSSVYPSIVAGIPDTIFDAKGDIIAASAADTAVRLAVGTQFQRLKPNTGETSGLEWDDYLDAGIVSNITNSATGDADVDTVITTGFEPKTIIIEYYLQGLSASGATTLISLGQAVYNQTTMEYNNARIDDEDSTASVTVNDLAVGWNVTNTPSAGAEAASGEVITSFTIASTSSTGFTINTDFGRTSGGSGTGIAGYKYIAIG